MVFTAQAAEVDFLREISLFANLDDGDLRLVASRLKRRRFKKGEVVYHQEDLPGSLYLTVSGALKLRLQSPGGKQLTISTILPGSFFGTISLLDGQERLADAIALEASELMVLGRDDFRTFLFEHPRETELLLEITAARWRNTMRRLADLAFLDVPGRLARVLIDLEKHASENGDLSNSARLLTQAELAAQIGTSRETVSRWLKTFTDLGLIERQRGRQRVIDEERLLTYVRW
jgi:CRP/FNR family transcriptional regulator/CRP/FNR family cyclic AMP-dependent transcriptional regulator